MDVISNNIMMSSDTSNYKFNPLLKITLILKKSFLIQSNGDLRNSFYIQNINTHKKSLPVWQFTGFTLDRIKVALPAK